MPLTNAEKQARHRTRKAEKMRALEDALRRETDLLDQMAFAHPDTFKAITGSGEEYHYRPGVAVLEMKAAKVR